MAGQTRRERGKSAACFAAFALESSCRRQLAPVPGPLLLPGARSREEEWPRNRCQLSTTRRLQSKSRKTGSGFSPFAPCLARHPRLLTPPTTGACPFMAPSGEVAEWLNAPHSKCGIGASLSGVRIPPSPPCAENKIHGTKALMSRRLRAAKNCGVDLRPNSRHRIAGENED